MQNTWQISSELLMIGAVQKNVYIYFELVHEMSFINYCNATLSQTQKINIRLYGKHDMIIGWP